MGKPFTAHITMPSIKVIKKYINCLIEIVSALVLYSHWLTLPADVLLILSLLQKSIDRFSTVKADIITN